MGAHQAVQVARLELVGVGGHRLQIADAEVADARRELVGEGERSERGVAAGAPAANGGARRVHNPLAIRYFAPLGMWSATSTMPQALSSRLR